jgi:hypothetical protein
MKHLIPLGWNEPPEWSRAEDDYTEEELEQLRLAHEDWEVEQALDKLNDKEY